jgi:hypothetical protein
MKAMFSDMLSGLGKYLRSRHLGDPATDEVIVALVQDLRAHAIVPWMQRSYLQVMGIRQLEGIEPVVRPGAAAGHGGPTAPH